MCASRCTSSRFSRRWNWPVIRGPSQCQHIPYELVNLPGNVVMASREGHGGAAGRPDPRGDRRALEVVEEKNPELSAEQKMAIARAVGIGAIKYPMLARENTKIVTFDWEAALDFNGQAAPYIQYAYVRANSILRKAGGVVPEAEHDFIRMHVPVGNPAG
jgi:arginyl-tRNA synthetase